jgi:hypothetical protein
MIRCWRFAKGKEKRADGSGAGSFSGARWTFESLIKVRIVGTERVACQMVKEAVLLAIQTALSDGDYDGSEDIPTQPRH